MNRKNLDELVFHNPMLIEIQRFRRRYFSFGGNSTLNSAVMGLAMVCFAGLVLLVWNGRGDISPMWLLIFQTGLFTLFAPGMLHSAIAGERERRSWDLLLVAPISKAQIVVGKFIGALAALAAAATIMLFPVLIAALTYAKTNWHDLLLQEAMSISFSIAVCAMTLLISARVRRPFMALGASLGTLGILLIVIPALMEVLLTGTRTPESEIAFYLHPFIALGRVTEIAEGIGPAGERFIPSFLWGWPHVAIYLLTAAVLIGWAANTLNFAENEVKFIPKGQHDA